MTDEEWQEILTAHVAKERKLREDDGGLAELGRRWRGELLAGNQLDPEDV